MMSRYISSVRVVAFLSGFCALPAFASGSASVDGVDALKGFSVGVDAVYSHINLHQDQIDSGSFVKRGSTAIFEQDDALYRMGHGRNVFVPSINVGYSYFYGSWCAGVSGNVSFGRKSNRSSVTGEVNSFSEIGKLSYGVKVKGGYYFDCLDSSVYGIAGLNWRDVSFQFESLDKELNGRSSKVKLRRPLFVLGVGMERAICKKLSVSAEYEYSWRNSRGVAVAEYANSTGSVSVVDQRMREHSLKVGFKYHF